LKQEWKGTIRFAVHRDYRCVLCNLSIVLYGPGNWSLTLRNEHRPRVFENKLLGRIIGPEEEEITGNDV
jgi:hypothetical protein